MHKDHGIEMEDDYFSFQSPQQLLQKIDCFVTLGQFDLDEQENFPQNIQVEQPEIKNFRLQKFFNEEPEPNQFVQRQIEVSHEPRMRPPRKMSQSLPSFMEELDTTISQIIEKQHSFIEQQKYNDALNNIDNFTFLEQSLKYPQVFKQFQQQYMRTITKLRQYRQQKRYYIYEFRLDVKQFMAFVCSIGIELIQEIFNLIHKADNSWCFELLKLEGVISHQNQMIQNQQFQESIQQIKYYPTSISIQSGNESALSIVNEAIEKKARKTWTNAELEILQNFINSYQNGSITNQQIQDLSNQLGRTWYSVQSKMQKMKKSGQDVLSDVRSQSMKVEAPKELKEQKSQRISTKYDYTVEDMIKLTLQSFDNKCGTKQRIIDSINKNFFNGQLSEDAACLRSISITLSNNRSQFIRKIKGTYGLKENYSEKPEDDNKMRNRLVWILQHLPEQQGTLQQIVLAYTQNMVIDEASVKKLQKQINQTLRQSNRFDKRNAKTIFKIQD